MKKSLIFILGLALICITSCEYKIIEPIVIEIPELPDGPDVDPISFSTQVEPIFQEKCVSCHASRTPILTTGMAYNSLTTGGYIDTIAPESSEIYIKVYSGHHSGDNSFNPEDLAYLLKWIEEGALNN
jgi:hypothetical protein